MDNPIRSALEKKGLSRLALASFTISLLTGITLCSSLGILMTGIRGDGERIFSSIFQWGGLPLGLAAMITGLAAIIRKTKTGAKGFWMAIVGFVLGCLVISFSLLLIYANSMIRY
jgi:hypothetical protein